LCANKKQRNGSNHHFRFEPFLSVGPFRGGNKPPVLPGEEKGFSKAKNGELKAAEVVANN